CPTTTPFLLFFSFFFTPPAPSGIYTLSLHDALPISVPGRCSGPFHQASFLSPRVSGNAAALECGDSRRKPSAYRPGRARRGSSRDRKSTRLNSSHDQISYAVFCLKKKKDNKPDEKTI